jgi:hypothetical protein
MLFPILLLLLQAAGSIAELLPASTNLTPMLTSLTQQVVLANARKIAKRKVYTFERELEEKSPLCSFTTLPQV